MTDKLLDALNMKREEATKVFLLAAYLFLAVGIVIAGRVCRDALFLKRFDRDMLAYMYITVAIAVPLPAYLYARVADRFRRDRIIQTTLIVLFTMLFGTYLLLLTTGADWVLIFLYNFVEVMGAFLMIQFWTFTGDVFASREAKRLFPMVGGGGVIAGIVCGVSVGKIGRAFGPDTLLLIMMAALLGCFLLVSHIGKRERTRLMESIAQRVTRRNVKKKTDNMTSDVKEVFKSKHLRIVAGMTVATFITVPLIDYQFKVLAKAHFTGADGITAGDELTHFFGLFYTATGVIAAITQFGFASRMLERFGVVTSLLVLPASLFLGTLGTIGSKLMNQIAFYFPLAVFSKGAENSFRYSIYDATMQVIYTPVPGHVRGRAKTFIDGILKPWAGGIAGGIIALTVGVYAQDVQTLSYVALGLIGCWVGLVLAIRREYVAQLLDTLRKRRLDFSQNALTISDEATVTVLRAALDHEDPAHVRNALALAPRVVGHDLSDDVVRLLDSPDVELRKHALVILGNSNSMRYAQRLQDLFKDESPTVRAEAVRSFCKVVGEPAIRVVQGHLQSPHAEVRGAAVASLIRHGGLEGILLSAEHLKEMQTSIDEDLRFCAANVFGEIGVKNFYQPVLALLRDPSVRVQTAAIQAAGTMQSSELIPALVYKLSRRETARAAALALAEFKDSVVPTLGKVLNHEPEDQHIRRQIPRILERVGTAEAFNILVGALSVGDPDTRREATRAAARLRERLDLPVDDAAIRVLIDREIADYYQHLAARADTSGIAGEDAPDLLRAALEERMDRTLDRVFKLLGIIYPLKTIELIQANLKSSHLTVRSNAIEVLDNLLGKEEKRKLLPIVEDLSKDRVLERGEEFYKIRRQTVQAWVGELLDSDEPWLVVVALYVVRELGMGHVTEKVLEHLSHTDPVARETALRSLAVLTPPANMYEHAEQLSRDRDATVRRYAKAMLKELEPVLMRPVNVRA